MPLFEGSIWSIVFTFIIVFRLSLSCHSALRWAVDNYIRNINTDYNGFREDCNFNMLEGVMMHYVDFIEQNMVTFEN